MKKALPFICAVVMSASFLLGALLSLLLHFAYNPSFYVWCMRGAEVFSAGNIDEDSTAQAMRQLTHYLDGTIGEMSVFPIYVNGEAWDFPNEREAAHMTDVARLFRLAEGVRIGCASVFAAAAIFVLIYNKRRRNGRRENAAAIGFGVSCGGLLIIALAGIVAYLASADFYSLFYRFHQLFFTNDLWLMNPAADIIIVLMPTAFFARFAGTVALAWLGFIILTIAIGFIIWKKHKPQSSSA
ncbi:MAG: TIGR01906 family membrane protein [Oscillospiraceae bacterium]|jgi:integral membrane protein (TIGR01906 family)|nr:TIGR01906 family membrane protein [Oscillospiraceae bacterium]